MRAYLSRGELALMRILIAGDSAREIEEACERVAACALEGVQRRPRQRLREVATHLGRDERVGVPVPQVDVDLDLLR